MRSPLSAMTGLALLLALALCGCGSSTPPEATASQPAATTPASTTIKFASPAIKGTIPARYTCDGQDIAPPITWGAIPSKVRELAVFAIDVTPTSAGRPADTVEWAMAGLKPTLHKVAAGELPPHAFMEEASNGKAHYSICPTKGKPRRYKFALYALPPTAVATNRITGSELLVNLTEATPEDQAPASGEFTASYTRK
jgi:phosphatidylethanolamine-binding protein (PEBP) family uncharacterized protein